MTVLTKYRTKQKYGTSTTRKAELNIVTLVGHLGLTSCERIKLHLEALDLADYGDYAIFNLVDAGILKEVRGSIYQLTTPGQPLVYGTMNWTTGEQQCGGS